MPNSKKDLDRVEECTNCGDDHPRRDMRGTTDGSWLCIGCWEDKHGSAAPPSFPQYSPPKAG